MWQNRNIPTDVGAICSVKALVIRSHPHGCESNLMDIKMKTSRKIPTDVGAILPTHIWIKSAENSRIMREYILNYISFLQEKMYLPSYKCQRAKEFKNKNSYNVYLTQSYGIFAVI